MKNMALNFKNHVKANKLDNSNDKYIINRERYREEKNIYSNIGGKGKSTTIEKRQN